MLELNVKMSIIQDTVAGPRTTICTMTTTGGTAPYVYSIFDDVSVRDTYAISGNKVVTTRAINVNEALNFAVHVVDQSDPQDSATSGLMTPIMQAAAQNMFNKTDVIYKITKDINLYGKALTIPANCILDFQGGKFIDGVVSLNASKIIGESSSIINVIDDGYSAPVKLSTGTLPLPVELYFAGIYDCTIHMKYKIGTPKRYGGVGDGVTDDSSAIQCALDVVSYNGGWVSFRREDNDNSNLWLTTKPLNVISSTTASTFKRETSSIKGIIGDTSDKYTDNPTTLIGKNLGSLEAVLVLSGQGNTRANHVELHNIKITNLDNSNSDNSFCLDVGAAEDIQCTGIDCWGKNGLLMTSSRVSSGSFAFINVKFDTCQFGIPNERTTYGFAVADRNSLDGGSTYLYDNTSFVNCQFWGLTMFSSNVLNCTNCMWYNNSNRPAVDIKTIYPDHTFSKDYTIQFSEAIIIGAAFNVSFNSCFFEDCSYIVDVLKKRYTDTNQHVISFNDCFINGFLNNGEVAQYIAYNEAAYVNFNSCTIRADYLNNTTGESAFPQWLFKTIEYSVSSDNRAVFNVDNCELIMYDYKFNPQTKCIGRFDNIKFISNTDLPSTFTNIIEFPSIANIVPNDTRKSNRVTIEKDGILHGFKIITSLPWSTVSPLLDGDLKMNVYFGKSDFDRITVNLTKNNFISLRNRAAIIFYTDLARSLTMRYGETYYFTISFTGDRATLWADQSITQLSLYSTSKGSFIQPLAFDENNNDITYILNDIMYNMDGTLVSNVKSISTPSQMDAPSYIYNIIADVDLGGISFTMPANCTLKFNGGKIINGELILQNTKLYIMGDISEYITATISGTYKEGQILYDNSLKKYKLWNGTAWVNMDGSALA